MTKMQRRLTAASTAVVLSCGVAAFVDAQPRPASERVPEQRPSAAVVLGRQPPVCDVVLEVKSTDPDERGHLKTGQWVRVFGPVGQQGPLLLARHERTGSPPHAWRPGIWVAHRVAPPSGPPPWYFFLSGVLVVSPPDHDDVTPHAYSVTVEELEDGCPGRIRFDALPGGDVVDDHPGHAVVD